jgi:aspartate kinase
MKNPKDHLTVCKFGGSSLANADQCKKVIGILNDNPSRRIVVVSAPGKDANHKHKITDILHNMYFNRIREENSLPMDYAGEDAPDKGVKYERLYVPNSDLIQMIEEQYGGIAQGLGVPKSHITDMIDELAILTKLNSGHSLDDIASRGEYFCAKLMAKAIGGMFVDAVQLIHIDEKKGVDNEITQAWMDALKGHKEKVVVPGYYGNSLQTGTKIKLLPRGGSDLSGGIVAACVGADIYENWTDQPGVRCVDPRLFDDHAERKKIPIIEWMTYMETRELSYNGFEIFHEEAMGPVMKRSIPINIRDTNNPSLGGTIINGDYEEAKKGNPIRGIAGTTGFCSVNVDKFLMNKEVGFGRNLLDIFTRRGINYEHAPSGVDAMSVVVRQYHIDGKEDEIKADILKELGADKVEFERGLALIAVVGEGMCYKPGMISKVSTALAEKEININIISQGGSERSIILGVHVDDYKNAMHTLYHSLLAKR